MEDDDDDGWEILPDDGFLQINDDGVKKIFSRNYGAGSGCVFKDYFICPDSKSTKFVEITEKEEEDDDEEWYPVKLIQLGNTFEKTIDSLSPSLLLPENLEEESDPNPDRDPDLVSRLKMMESPIRSMKPPPFPAVVDDDATTDLEVEGVSLMKNEIKNGGFKLKIWKWRLTSGIGAICSFGFATVCIVFFGVHQRKSKLQQFQENNKLKFHIYSDEKGLKEKAARRGSSVSMNKD